VHVTNLQGVVGAATGAGVIIGTYFAFYSTTKRFLRSNTQLNEGESGGCGTAGRHGGLGRKGNQMFR